MKNKIATHEIEYKKDDDIYWHVQRAYGLTDLYNTLREMQKDGYTEFKIKVIKMAA